MDDYKIALGALLDANAKGDIDKQLKAIKDLSVTVSKATLDQSVINDIKRQLSQNGIDLKLVFGNVGQINSQAQQIGQQVGNNIGQQITQSIGSAIQKGTMQITDANGKNIKNLKEFRFDAKLQQNDVAKQALKDFQALGQGIVTVKEEMKNIDGKTLLNGFTINIKNAKGEVESLRYALKDIEGKTGKSFQYVGGTINDAGAVKQIKAIENAFASFTQKIEQFKSTNNGKLSGLTQPLTDFETKLAGLKSGAYTIDEVKNAFKLLQAEVSKIDAPLKATIDRFSATKTVIDNGKKSISDYREALKGLNNAPKELSQELTKASKLLVQINNIEKSEGTTANWSVKAREFTNMLDSIKGKIDSLKMQQANGSTTTIYSKKDIENLLYVQKILNTVSKTEGELRTKLANAGYTNIKIKGIEDATGKVKELEVTANNAAGALEKINFSRIKVQGGGKTQRIQDWLVQSGDVQVLKSATTAQEELAKSAQRASSNLADLKSKWESQGVLVGEFKTKVEQLESSLTTVGSKGELDKLTSQIRTLKTEASQIADVNKIQLLSNGGIKNDYATQIAKLEGDFRSLGLAQDTITTKTQNVKNSLATLRAEFAKPVDQQNFQAIQTANDNLQRELIESRNEFEQLRASMKGMATEQQRLSLANTIEAWNQKNTAATKAVREENERYVITLRDLNTQMTKMQLGQINTSFKQTENSMRALNKLGASLANQWKQATASFTMWLSASTMVMALISKIRKIPGEVIKVNSAMIELTKVSSASENELKNYFDEAAKSAKDLGATISDVISATADFSRLGYNLPDASELAKVATLYKNVGDGIDIDQSSSSIVSTMKAFKIEASDAIGIVDKFNEVGNNFAISSGEIGDALTRSASSLSVARNSLSEAIGLITAGNTIVQDADVVGTALKTVSLRITSTSAELEELGEDTEFACETLSDYRDLVMGLTDNNVDIIGDDGEYKSTYQILKDISGVWEDMNSMEQSSLMKALFGVRQANIGASILENFDIAESAMKTAEESAGSALKEQERYEKGIQFSLDRLSASFQEFANHILDSQFLKGIVDFGNSTINVIDDVVTSLGSLGTIGLGAGLFASFKGAGRVKIAYPHLYTYACRNKTLYA